MAISIGAATWFESAPPRSPANQIIPVVDFRFSQVGWIAWVTPGPPDNALTVLHT